jgi:putative SOS response-associated peptidase YedK
LSGRCSLVCNLPAKITSAFDLDKIWFPRGQPVCGRFVRQKEVDAIVKAFGVQKVSCDISPSYNIAPTQDVAVIIEEGVKQLVAVRWGLVPSWAQDLSGGSRLINARAETISRKATFKDAFQKRRCLVVADGFYEWQKTGSTRQPILIRLKGGRGFGFAGLYENWISPEGKNIRTCTIITTEPNEVMQPIHNRMPVIIPRDQEDRWLDPSIDDPAPLLDLLRPYPAAEMETCQVSTIVNSPANDTPECLVPSGMASSAEPTLPFID